VKEILVLYYSQGGSVHQMAQVARGVESAKGVKARIRTVPKVSANFD
jgi:NAD(P)H dehydrogenase (quinone)